MGRPQRVCSVCGKDLSPAEAVRPGMLCPDCRAEEPTRALSPEARAVREREAALMRLGAGFPQWTTMPPGSYESLGIVAGTAMVPANLFSDLELVVLNALAGSPRREMSALAEGRLLALGEMCEQAQARGADMVVGVRIDVETAPRLFLVCATGTAVRRSS